LSSGSRDRVVALARAHGRLRATGEEADYSAAHSWTMVDGTPVRFDEYVNAPVTLAAADAVTGCRPEPSMCPGPKLTQPRLASCHESLEVDLEGLPVLADPLEETPGATAPGRVMCATASEPAEPRRRPQLIYAQCSVPDHHTNGCDRLAAAEVAPVRHMSVWRALGGRPSWLERFQPTMLRRAMSQSSDVAHAHDAAVLDGGRTLR
jgi:hypothetical protein